MRVLTKRREIGMLCAIAFALVAATTQAQTAAVNIVALGASNTAGKGLSSQQAYPAQLEAMLRRGTMTPMSAMSASTATPPRGCSGA